MMFDWLYFWRRAPRTPANMPEAVPLSRPLAPDAVRAQIFMHANIRQEMGGNYRAPITAPTRILDLRSASAGRWALEMARAFPAATVIALASNPLNPAAALDDDLTAVPPNATFMQGELIGALPFPDQSFDLVSWRMLYALLPAEAWPPLLAECVRILRPGGWLEGMEQLPFPRGQLRESMATIINWNSEVLRQDGKDPLVALKLPRLFQEAGLQDVTTHDVFSTNLTDQRRERIRQSGLRYIDLSKGPIVAHHVATAEEFDQVAVKARLEFQGKFVSPGLKTTDIIGRKAL